MDANIIKINNSDTKINLKNDFVFKKLFSENEKLLVSLLEAILKVKITKIDVAKDFALSKDYKLSRGGILDIKAEIDGKINVNIEMQVRNKHNITHRMLFYGTRLRDTTIKEGEDFSKIRPVISIGILDYINYDDEKATNFISESEFGINQINLEGEKIELEKLNEKLHIILIELPKFKKIKHHDLSNDLQQWLTVIEWKNFKEIENVMKNNEEIKEAVKQLTVLLDDKEIRQVYEYEEQTKMVRKTEDRLLKEKATAEGIEKGIKQGKYKTQKEIIMRLVNSGMQLEDIAKIIQMEIKEIEQIIKDK